MQNPECPKIEVTALVVRYPDGRTVVTALHDGESDSLVTYPSEAITLEQLTEAAIMLCRSDHIVGRVIRRYQSGQDVTLDGPAALLPSIGGVKVSVETKILNWE